MVTPAYFGVTSEPVGRIPRPDVRVSLQHSLRRPATGYVMSKSLVARILGVTGRAATLASCGLRRRGSISSARRSVLIRAIPNCRRHRACRTMVRARREGIRSRRIPASTSAPGNECRTLATRPATENSAFCENSPLGNGCPSPRRSPQPSPRQQPAPRLSPNPGGAPLIPTAPNHLRCHNERDPRKLS